jgi:hypothetical protein
MRRFPPFVWLTLVASIVLGPLGGRGGVPRTWPESVVGGAIEHAVPTPRVLEAVRLAAASILRSERARDPGLTGRALMASGSAPMGANPGASPRGQVRTRAILVSSNALAYYPTGPPIRA